MKTKRLFVITTIMCLTLAGCSSAKSKTEDKTSADVKISNEISEADTSYDVNTTISNKVSESIYDGNTYLLTGSDYPDFTVLSEAEIMNVIQDKNNNCFFALKDGNYYFVFLSYAHNIKWQNEEFSEQELYNNLNASFNETQNEIANMEYYIDDFEVDSIGNLEFVKYLKTDSNGNEIWGYYYPAK